MAEKSQKKPKKSAGAKVISMHKDDSHLKETTLQQAAAAEKDEDLEQVEKLYKKQMQEKVFNPFVYTRLMVLYRKQKRYKDELNIINKGLKHFKQNQASKLSSKNKNAAIKKLSKSLNKTLGLIDKKGNSIYEPEPIPTWKKRKANVEKKIKSASR